MTDMFFKVVFTLLAELVTIVNITSFFLS